jgi:hypothetical protein
MYMRRNANGIDSQKSKLYKAEGCAFLPLESKMRDVSTIELYQARVDTIMGSDWILAHYPKAARGGNVPVRIIPGLRGANANSRRIHTSKYGMREWYLIHELCHVIVARQFGERVFHSADGKSVPYTNMLTPGVAHNIHFIVGHGPEYADVYLRVVRRFLGRMAYEALRDAFRAHRVRYGTVRARDLSKPAGKPPVSPEGLAAGVAASRRRAIESLAAKLRVMNFHSWRLRHGRTLYVERSRFAIQNQHMPAALAPWHISMGCRRLLELPADATDELIYNECKRLREEHN